jgi:hypothetical protein
MRKKFEKTAYKKNEQTPGAVKRKNHGSRARVEKNIQINTTTYN